MRASRSRETSKPTRATGVGLHVTRPQQPRNLTHAGTSSLAGALQRLESKSNIHAALKRGFTSLYGFTSDEKSIRHPLLDGGAANVDETDAIFMIGACAVFVSYLINKHRASEGGEPDRLRLATAP